MRLLIATDHFPPFIGGAHRWASLLCSGLAGRGHDVTVATMWHGGLPAVERHGPHGVVVHRLRQLRTAVPALVPDSRQHHSPPLPDPIMVGKLRRLIRAERPEVVLSHGWISSAVLRALRGSDIPLVLSSHDYGFFCPKRDLLYRGHQCSGPAPLKCLGCARGYYGAAKGAMAVAGVAQFKRLAPHGIAGVQSVTSFVDDMNAQHFLRTNPDHVRRFTIPAFLNGDPRDEIGEHDLDELLARLPDEPFILFVGALRPLKGIEVLFDAYARLREPPPLVLMGTIERDTPKPFPPGAILFTDVPHAAVMAAWSRALLGVVPSVWPEPLGTVAVEGIAQGVPMIATVPSGMVDVLGDGIGILIPHGDVSALMEAIQTLIADPARREVMSRAGRERAPEFGAERVLARYEQMLSDVIAGR